MVHKESVPVEVNGLHHYTISVSSLESSVEWYSRKLGFRLLTRTIERTDEEIAWLYNHGAVLKIVQVQNPNPLPPYRSHPATDNEVQGNKHFSLRVVDGARAESELKALGINPVFVPVIGETYGVFICDPTGNLIEILQESLPPPDVYVNNVSGIEPIAIEGWSHVAISVPSIDESVKWYKRVFGFTAAHSDSVSLPDGHTMKITWLSDSNFSLELFEIADSVVIPHDRTDPFSDIKTLGNKYFALSTKDLNKTRTDLESLGVPVIQDNRANSDSFHIHDNAKNVIEICRL